MNIVRNGISWTVLVLYRQKTSINRPLCITTPRGTRFSIVLLAVVNALYKLIYIGFGSCGKEDDGGIKKK